MKKSAKGSVDRMASNVLLGGFPYPPPKGVLEEEDNEVSELNRLLERSIIYAGDKGLKLERSYF